MIPYISFIRTFLLTKTLVVVQLLIHADFHVLCAGIQIHVPDTEKSNPKTEYLLLNPITSLSNKYCCLRFIMLSFSICTFSSPSIKLEGALL